MAWRADDLAAAAVSTKRRHAFLRCGPKFAPRRRHHEYAPDCHAEFSLQLAEQE
jgi:hypothetical protein